MMTAGRPRMEQSGERPAWPLHRCCAPAQAGHGAGAVLGGAALGQAVGRVPGRPASIQRVLAQGLVCVLRYGKGCAETLAIELTAHSASAGPLPGRLVTKNRRWHPAVIRPFRPLPEGCSTPNLRDRSQIVRPTFCAPSRLCGPASPRSAPQLRRPRRQDT